MNYNEEKKKGNGLLVVVIILLVVLIGVGGVLIYQNYQNKNNELQDVEITDKNNENKLENNDSGSSEINDNSLVTIDIDSELVNLLINKLEPLDDFAFRYLYPDNSYYAESKFGIMYKLDRLLAENLPVDVKSYLVAAELYSEKEEDTDFVCEYKLTVEAFREEYYNFFGKNANYEIVAYDFALPLLRFQGDEIIIGSCGGDTRGPGYFIYSKYIRAEKNKSEIYLYEKVAFADEREEVVDKYNFYSDVEYTKMIIDDVSEEEIFSSKYIDKLPEYKYTFKLEDGNYYFYSVERVK